jgi:hypothetical protein
VVRLGVPFLKSEGFKSAGFVLQRWLFLRRR